MSNRVFICFFAILTSIGWVATDIYLPSLPHMTQYFQTSITLTQMSLPAYLISFAISPLVAGPYSDMVGRKRVLLVGLAVSIVATLICIAAFNIYILILGRFLQGLGYGMVVTTARAMLPDKYEGADISRIASINGTLAPIIMSMAPLLGGFIQEYSNWHMVFVTILIYSTAVWVAVSLKLEETNLSPRKLTLSQVKANYISLFKNRNLMLYGTIPAFVLAGAGSYMTMSPYIFQKLLGLSPSEYGMIAILIGSVIVASGILNTHLLERFSQRGIATFAGFLMCLSSALLFLVHYCGYVSAWTVAPICTLYFMNINLTMPNIYALAFRYIDAHFGTAMAILNSLLIIGITLSSGIASVLPEHSILPLACMLGIAGLLTSWGMWLTRDI